MTLTVEDELAPVATIALDPAFPVLSVDIGVKFVNFCNYIVGYSTPVPTSPATVLATVQLLVLDNVPVHLTMGPANPASLGSALPIIMREDYSLMPVGMSAPVGPSASINAVDCSVVATDQASWDSIKAMYR
jgi:hypothetical protein